MGVATYARVNGALLEENRNGTVTTYVADTLGSDIKTGDRSCSVSSGTTARINVGAMMIAKPGTSLGELLVDGPPIPSVIVSRRLNARFPQSALPAIHSCCFIAVNHLCIGPSRRSNNNE